MKDSVELSEANKIDPEVYDIIKTTAQIQESINSKQNLQEQMVDVLRG